MSDIPPIIKRVILRATPEALFDAYTDPDHLEKWFAASARIDLKPNSAWRYEWPGGLAAEGRVIETDRPNRFVWSWEKSISPDPDGGEQVYESETVNTYLFEAVDAGTQFTIDERYHESQEVRDMSEGGIDEMLRMLKAYVEDGTVVDWTQAPAS